MDDTEEASNQAERLNMAFAEAEVAATNNINNNIYTATDNEATNCSETMSTNDEEYNVENLEQTGNSDQYQALINVTTSSTKNRISTPRRVLQQRNLQQQQRELNCDSNYNQVSDRSSFVPPQQQRQQQQQQQSNIPTENNNQDYETTETNTLSLASACQAPPSYGTATRGDNNVVVTLDAEQLNDVLGNCPIIVPGQQLSSANSSNSNDNQLRHQQQQSYVSATTRSQTGPALLVNANPTESLLFGGGGGSNGDDSRTTRGGQQEDGQQANSKTTSLFSNAKCAANSNAANEIFSRGNKTIGISRTMESLAHLGLDEQQQQQQQQQKYLLQQQRELQTRPYSFFNVVNNGINTRNQTDTKQTQLRLLSSNEQQQQRQGTTTSQLSAYLSSSASLPRIQFASHLNGPQTTASSSNSIAVVGLPSLSLVGQKSNHANSNNNKAATQNQAPNFANLQINLGLDNNQASCSKWQLRQQQPQHQIVGTKMFVRDPINHVISARESMHWKPQTNQYYATSFSSSNTTRTLPAGSGNGSRSNSGAKSLLESHNQQQQQPQPQLGIMDAAAVTAFNVSTISHNSLHWPFNGATKGNHNEQAAGSSSALPNTTTTANTTFEPQLLGGGSSSRFPRSISTAVAGEYPNSRSTVATALAAVPPTTTTTTTTTTAPPFDCKLLMMGPENSNRANNQQIYGTTTALTAMPTPLRRSDENLSRSSRKQRDQAVQHRKRRRHRSTSGRSLSPVENGKRASNQHHYESNSGGGANYLNSSQSNNNVQNKENFPTEHISSNNVLTKSNHQHQQQQNKQAISAHCWLIDSSDDQAEAGYRKEMVRQSSQKMVKQQGDKIDQQQQQTTTQHLTVAMMRQSELRAQKMMQQQHSGFSQSGEQKRNKVYDKDLTLNLKTNSLKLERILDRDNNSSSGNVNKISGQQPISCEERSLRTSLAANNGSGKKRMAVSVGSKRKSCTVPRRMRFEQRSLSATNSSVSSPERSSSSCNSSRSPRHAHHATTVVRLSALLSMISNLVKRGPKCLKVGSIYSTSSSSNNKNNNNHCIAPANSISGSISAPSVNLVAPYTAGSLAISSSSSTSAYATGSSHLSSNISNPSRTAAFNLGRQHGQNNNSSGNPMNNNNKPIGLAHFKAPSSASTAGSSLFYSSTSGTSALHQNQHPTSSHGYEYCDDDIQVDETKFNQNDVVPICVTTNANHLETQLKPVVPSASSPVNSTNLASLEQLSIASSGSQSERQSNSNSQLQTAAADKELRRHMIMSDNELISAGSDLNTNEATAAGFNIFASSTVVLPARSLVQSATGSSAARRRWWWNSVKDWLRRPCKSASSDPEFHNQSSLNQNKCDTSAARYKSLRSASSKRNSSGNNTNTNNNLLNNDQSSSSTIQNVMSLAKADRVFRIRLIASIIVSCILVGLLGTLISLLYLRSNHHSLPLYQNNRLNFLIDDSDYDLSWLWTKNNVATQNPTKLRLPPFNNQKIDQKQQQSTISGEQQTTDRVKTLAEQQIDNALRAQIVMIEQSERLNQFHETITFLTNIQLANDNFIDISQLTKQLATQQQQQQQQQLLLNKMTESMQTRAIKIDRNNITTTSNLATFYLSDSDRDLVSLTLLSNLHWPLVKWRHQNQRSMANFLSFSISPSLFGGSQTLKNFLSLLMLAESIGDHSPQIHITRNNLNQFLRLHSLLKSASYHLVHCSHLIMLLQQNDNDFLLEESSNNLKSKFCLQLVNGYKRMMSTLSQLDHHHLSKFNNLFEQSPLVNSGFQEQQEYSNTYQQQQQKHLPTTMSSSRTLLGFFLDRLALLDVQNIAEATLSKNSNDFDTSVANSNQLINQLTNWRKDEKLSLSPSNKNNDDYLSKSSLIDLAKLVIGESPMNLNINLEKNRELQQRFVQLEAENGDNWRDMLVKDLLYPWTSYKLSRFVIPNNYDLFLHPNLTTRFISGMVKIEFHIERATRFLVINCENLNIVDISLMLKQPSDHLNIDHLLHSNQNLSNSLKLIPIRRILLNTKLEQLYIELYDPIKPFIGGGESISTNQQQQTGQDQQQQDAVSNSNNIEQAHGINFGDLPIYTNNYNNNNNVASSDRYNNFVINISFNKTNLMSSGEHFKESSGLKFIQYGDYFAQPEAEVKTILYTQFEPTNARRVFPCFDEPHLKAKVQLNLVHEQNHQVLFNAPKREKIPFSSDGLIQMSVFESVPIPISTYLISFIVCDSQNIKSITSRVQQLQIDSRGFVKPQQSISGDQQKFIQVQIVASFEHLSQAEYSSQLVPQLLAFYQNYLQFPYPLDKLDLIALPKNLPQFDTIATTSNLRAMNSFQIDTMENLGLIWFKEPLLLMDTNLISQNLIEQVSMIISHQIAHQYFGNIVSIAQWQDLWLYESLCQYLESIALSSVQVDWKLEEQFVVTTIQETLTLEQFDTLQYGLSSSSPSSSSPYSADASSSSSSSSAIGGNVVPLSMPAVPLDLLVSPSMVEFEPSVDQATPSTIAAAVASASLAKNAGSDLESDLQSLEGSQDVVDNTTTLLKQSQSQEQFAADKLTGTTTATTTTATTTDSSLFNSIELRRSSAILHMLLFNLLPSSESQARLLRRCLDVYKYRTMSQIQFWRLFGEQLTQEASLDRLSLDLSKFSAQTSEVFEQRQRQQLPIQQQQQQQQIELNSDSSIGITKNKTSDQVMVNQVEQHASERVVFVRPVPKRDHDLVEGGDTAADNAGEDIHKIRPRSNRLVDNLDLVVNFWLQQHNYPLITASAYRDKLHLRQERFSFAWWDDSNTGGGGADSGSGDINYDSVHAKWTSSEHIEILLPSENPTPTLVKRSPSLSSPSQQQQQQQQQQQTSSQDTSNELSEHPFDVWPIPLMFVSSFNPKQAQFFWMDKREMKVPFGDHLSSVSPVAAALTSPLLSPENSRLSDYSSSPELRSISSRGYSNTWFKLNVNQSSLVRVNYDERNWEALTELLVKSHYSNHLLSSLDRANLIDDAFTLMRCGKLSVGIAMNLTLYLEVGEREYMPWTSALKHLDQMQTLLNQNPLWHRYVLKLMQPISSVIGWKDDGPHLMRKMRRNLFSVALQYGDDKIVNKAKSDFKSWFKNGRFIVPNLQELVYVAGVLYGDQQEWFHCWQKYQQLVSLDSINENINDSSQSTTTTLLNNNRTNNNDNIVDNYPHNTLRDQRQSQSALISGMIPTSIIGSSEYNEVNTENEKRQLLTALASTHNTWLLEQFLNYSIDSSKIQPHHLKHVLQTLGKNSVARLYLWRFVRLNWATLVDKYMTKPNEPYNSNSRETLRGSSSDYQQVLETMIIESTKHFATKLDYDEVKAFFDAKQKQRLTSPNLIYWSPSVERAILHSLQIIKSNIYWRNFIEPKLAKWLSHFDNTIIN